MGQEQYMFLWHGKVAIAYMNLRTDSFIATPAFTSICCFGFYLVLAREVVNIKIYSSGLYIITIPETC